MIEKNWHFGSILPDKVEVNPRDPRVKLNAVLLMELHARAISNKSLTDGMPEFIALLAQSLSITLKSAIHPAES